MRSISCTGGGDQNHPQAEKGQHGLRRPYEEARKQEERKDIHIIAHAEF